MRNSRATLRKHSLAAWRTLVPPEQVELTDYQVLALAQRPDVLRRAAWESLRQEVAAALRADEHGRRAAERRFGPHVKNYKRFKSDG